MEAIMKKTPWIAAASLLVMVTIMIVALGCSEDKSTTPGSDAGGISAVQVWMPVDTLRFLPGDSAVAEGWVVVKDNGGRGIPNVAVDIVLSQPFGFIEYVNSTRDTTDTNGRVYFRFRSYNQTGQQTITASAGGRSDTWSLAVLQASDIIRTLEISLSKERMETPPGGQDSVQVTVLIADTSGQGISGITLPLNATGGSFAALPPTDNAGRAVTWWYFTNTWGEFTITVRAGGLTRSATIRVDESQGYGTLDLFAWPRSVRADRGVTTASLMVTLKNQLGIAITGDTIYFAAPTLGTVDAYGVTDAQGIATATFGGGGVPSADPSDSAIVIARYLKWGLVDTVRIFIHPAAQIETISLRANTMIGTAGVDSTQIQVNVYYDDGLPVNGLPITFGKKCGQFTFTTDTLVGGTTSQDNYWRFCNQTTDDTVRALVWANVGDNVSDTLEFTVNPGPARRLRVQAASTHIPINERLQCWADVRDSLNNRVRQGVPVMFTTTLGTLSPQSPVQTNANGIAFVELNPGIQAGQTIIRGSIASESVADSTIVTIQSGTAAAIQLNVPNPSVQVRGTGGQDWTQIIANVIDAMGNPAPDGHWVVFEITDAPPGCNINNRGLVDSAQTAAGLATVTFNAGTRPGPAEVEARTFTGADTARARVSNITVVAGPPRSIDIQPSDLGTDVDGAAWNVVVTAIVRDEYNNPVRNGIAVFFELWPDTAAILSDTVVTGNGAGVPGIAYTTLQYLSAATNQMVWITARTAGADSVSETVEYKLPIQTPSLNLYLSQTSWHFVADGDPCRIECTAEVRDAHGILINGSKVVYSPARGRMYVTCAGGTTRYYNFTGPPYHTEFGKTMLCLRENATFIFPDPNIMEITGDVSAQVEGYPVAFDSELINFRRGQGFTDRGPLRDN